MKEERSSHKLTSYVGVLALLSCASWLSPSGTTAQSAFDEEFTKADTPQQLDLLLKNHPEKGNVIIPKLEIKLIEEIAGRGAGDRFVIKEPPPLSAKMALFVASGDALEMLDAGEPKEQISVTLFAVDELKEKAKGNFMILAGLGAMSGRVLFSPEFPGDKDSSPTHGGSTVPRLPLADGSVHRIRGKVTMGEYTFLSEGDQLNRLTFGIVKDIGYVYVRGRGAVTLPNGEKIELGTGLTRPPISSP
jgi:hypothetical protein